MIKVKVTKENISILGHANYDDYGKDIVCASASSIIICSVEAISKFDINAIDINEETNKLEIKINKQDEITLKLIDNMLTCLKELEKKYPKNIKIIDREE
ncbi:MAG: ribosomal-processing cysteine protease Prp [Bacilli bacterium]|nr:ribosomal-processing cysteine protease Prp [Bacilli bacterium]